MKLSFTLFATALLASTSALADGRPGRQEPPGRPGRAIVAPAAAKPWIFFDMGKTLIDHSEEFNEEEKGYEREWFMPGALDYLTRLKATGYRVGLIVNWPPEWGSNFPQRLAVLEHGMAHGWTEATPFDWSLFDAVLIPSRREEYKGEGDLTLYRRALALAAPCAAVYQGENPAEIAEARSAGMVSRQVGPEGAPFYLPVDRVESFVRRATGGASCPR